MVEEDGGEDLEDLLVEGAVGKSEFNVWAAVGKMR